MTKDGHWNAGLTTTAGITLGAIGAIVVATVTVHHGVLEWSDWLQFAGILIGAGATIGAGILAWASMQRQIISQENLHALDKLGSYAERLRGLLNEYAVAVGDFEDNNPAERISRMKSFNKRPRSPEFMTIYEDTLLGDDREAVAALLIQMDTVSNISTKVTMRRSARTNIYPLYFEIADSIDKRRRALEQGRPLPEVRNMSFIAKEAYSQHEE